MGLILKKFLFFAFCLAVITTSLGCASGLFGSRSHELMDPNSPPTHPLPVFDSLTIDRPYRVIGIISVKSGSYKRQQSSLYKLKVKAIALGGQAIMDFREGGVWVQGVKEGPRSSPFHLYSAKVIVFVEEEKE